MSDKNVEISVLTPNKGYVSLSHAEVKEHLSKIESNTQQMNIEWAYLI